MRSRAARPRRLAAPGPRLPARPPGRFTDCGVAGRASADSKRAESARFQAVRMTTIGQTKEVTAAISSPASEVAMPNRADSEAAGRSEGSRPSHVPVGSSGAAESEHAARSSTATTSACGSRRSRASGRGIVKKRLVLATAVVAAAISASSAQAVGVPAGPPGGLAAQSHSEQTVPPGPPGGLAARIRAEAQARSGAGRVRLRPRRDRARSRARRWVARRRRSS